MAVAQALALGVKGVMHPPRASGGFGFGCEFSNFGSVRIGMGNRTKRGSVVMEQEGHGLVDFRVRALETTLSAPSSAAVPEKTSLGEITRDDFPILDQEINGKRLVYLDNAATSQKPSAVLNTLKEYYAGYNSNVHRGIHALSAKATEHYEIARSRVAKFINAPSHADVVFTRNASEAINLVAYAWGLQNMSRGDEVSSPDSISRNVMSGTHFGGNLLATQLDSRLWNVIQSYRIHVVTCANSICSTFLDKNNVSGNVLLVQIILSVAEHHSNIVPWQLIAEKTGIVLKFANLTEDERTDVAELKTLISNKTKLVSLHHVSNTLASINPVEDIIEYAHKYGAKVLLDACQSVPHMPVDVQALDVDFLVASSHKMCGPTGIGFLYGKSEILEGMPPWMGGGDMIDEVYLDHSTYASPPSRFEAGTPAIGEAIGFGAAVEYLSNIGMDRIHAYEVELSKYLYDNLSTIPGIKIYGPSPGSSGEDRAALCSFNIDGLHPTDIATVLDMEHAIAVRSGHHCTQPLHRYLNINASARASLYFYNTKAEVDSLIIGLKDAVDFFGSMR